MSAFTADLQDPLPPTTTKRKASPDLPEDDAATTAKRTKVDDDTVQPNRDADDAAQNGAERRPSMADTRPSAAATAGRRPGRNTNISLEEKKRGQRLFGGLVSALSSNSVSGPGRAGAAGRSVPGVAGGSASTRGKLSEQQQERRREMERRAQQRRAEDEKKRAEKRERLRKVRLVEQVRLDEEAMKTRHAAMLARAHSLFTKTEPRIYYLPWQLTKEQEETIHEQVREAQETIDRETRDWERRKEQRLKELGVEVPPTPEQSQQDEPATNREEGKTESNKKEQAQTVGEPTEAGNDTNPSNGESQQQQLLLPSTNAQPGKTVPAQASSSSTGTSVADSTSQQPDHEDAENGDEMMMQDAEDTVIY